MFIEDICRLFEPQATEKKLEFECKLSKDIPESVFSDERRLGQVIVNVLGNAIKFTSKGFVRVSGAITRREQRSYI